MSKEIMVSKFQAAVSTARLSKKHYNFTLNERKSRMPQIRGIKGRSRLLRALDNEENRVSSTFPTGKQNGIF